jgi:hypothetical protein
MDTKNKVRIAIANLMLSCLILLDLFLPTNDKALSELSSIYSYVEQTSSSVKPTFDAKIILELTNGNRYRIGKFPERDYPKGTKIIIVKSFFSKNVNEIRVFENGWKKMKVGLFSNFFVALLFTLVVLVSGLNLFYSNRIFQIMLVASLLAITLLTYIYFVFF